MILSGILVALVVLAVMVAVQAMRQEGAQREGTSTAKNIVIIFSIIILLLGVVLFYVEERKARMQIGVVLSQKLMTNQHAANLAMAADRLAADNLARQRAADQAASSTTESSTTSPSAPTTATDDLPPQLPPARPSRPPPPADPNSTDLGELQLTPGVAVTVTLNNGQTCTITPLVLSDGKLQLTLATSGTTGDNTISSQSTNIVVTPNVSVALRLAGPTGPYGLTFTPKLKQ